MPTIDPGSSADRAESSLSAFLASTLLFQGLALAILEELAEAMEPVPIPGGEALFRAGDPADAMFIILHGRLRVFNEKGAERQLLAEVGRGDVIGEMALMTGGTRTATVLAARDSELLRLSADRFERLAMAHPKLLMVLAERAISRYQAVLESDGRAAQAAVQTIAVLPTHPDVDLMAAVAAVCNGLGKLGTATLVGSAEVEQKFGPAVLASDPAGYEERLAGFLHNLEALNNFVVYVCDSNLSDWTQRCLRQADRFLLVAHDQLDPAPGEVEHALRQRQSGAADGVVLALIHREVSPFYRDTARFLESREGIEFHHICLTSDADQGRLARVVAGRTLGLVLGGGGARCFAQIGVLRALEECGLAVDFVGGTSMGAFLGLQHAMGWSVEEMIDFNRYCWTKLRPLKDFTLPYLGVISGKKFKKMVADLFGDFHLEDVRLNYFCCASNLSEAKVVVLDRGLITKWIGASMAVPGVAPPVFDSGRLFIDGALLANLPTDVMAKRCQGPVLAVDVTPEVDVLTDESYTDAPSSWALWARKLNPFSESLNVPNLVEVLGRATALASLRRMSRARSQADLLLTPPIASFALFEWNSIDQIIEVGYEFALPILQNAETKNLLAGDAGHEQPTVSVD